MPKELALISEDIPRLYTTLEPFSETLSMIFSRKKFDQKDEDQFTAISANVTDTFRTPPHTTSPKQKLIFRTMMQIFEICRTDQSFRELFFNEQNLNAKIIELIRIKNEEPKILEKPSDGTSYTTDLIKRLRAYGGRSVILNELDLDVKSFKKNDSMGPVTISELIARMTLDPNVINYIASHFQCEAVYDTRDRFSIKFTPVAEKATRLDKANFDTLRKSLLPMARCEGKTYYEEDLAEVAIFNPENIFAFYDRVSKVCGVGSLNMLMSSIYRNAMLKKEFLGETDPEYEKLVNSIFIPFIFSEETEKFLREKLLSADYVTAFYHAIETGKGFDLDLYRPNDLDLEDEISAIHASSEENLLVAFYGKERLLRNRSISFGFGKPNSRRFLLIEEAQEFPRFPGIGLRRLSEKPGRHQYEFFISNPILAGRGIVEFRAFFKDLEKTTAAYVAEAPLYNDANIKLERIIENLHNIKVDGTQEQVLRFGLYGEKDLSAAEDVLGFGIADGNFRRFFLEKKIRAEFPNFPGIELRLISPDGDSERIIYEFCVSDPSLAEKEGLAKFDEFFKEQKGKAEEYIIGMRRSVSSNLSNLRSLFLKNLKPSNNPHFPIGPVLKEALTKIRISTKETSLVDKIIARADSFRVLTFEKEERGLTLGIKRGLPLTSDLRVLEEIINEHKNLLASEAAQKLLADKERERLALEAQQRLLDELMAEEGAASGKKGKGKKATTTPEVGSKKAAPTPENTRAKKAEELLRLDIEKAFANLTDFLEKNTGSLRSKLNISADLELYPEISFEDHPTKCLAIQLTNISREPSIASLPNYKLTFDEKSHSLKIEIDASKFSSVEEASNQLKGFIRSQIISRKDSLFPAPKPAVAKGKVSRLTAARNATTEVTPPSKTSAGAEEATSKTTILTSVAPDYASTTGSALSVASSSHSTTPSEEEEEFLTLKRQKLDFDSKILRCIERRRDSANFNPSLVEHFPDELKKLIRILTTSKAVTETQIYGGFVYSSNPKDLDLQVVLANNFFYNKTDAEATKLLQELLPPELAKISKIERKVVFPPIWRIDIGNLLQITTIEQRDHERNENWTSSRDAQIIILRSIDGEAGSITTSPSHQFGFRQRCGKLYPPTTSFLINDRAKDCALRVVYSAPQRLNDSLLKHLSSTLTNDLIVKGPCIDSLLEKISAFEEDHAINGEELKTFRHNFSQVLEKLDLTIFSPKQSLEEVSEKISQYKSMSDFTTTPAAAPAPSPAPRTDAAASLFDRATPAESYER